MLVSCVCGPYTGFCRFKSLLHKEILELQNKNAPAKNWALGKIGCVTFWGMARGFSKSVTKWKKFSFHFICHMSLPYFMVQLFLSEKFHISNRSLDGASWHDMCFLISILFIARYLIPGSIMLTICLALERYITVCHPYFKCRHM